MDIMENKKGKFYILHYEDLILNQDRSLKTLCEYLEIEFEDNILNYNEVLNACREVGLKKRLIL